MLEGGISLGFTAGSIKVAPTQINAYFWAWTAIPTDMPNGVSDCVCSQITRRPLS
jgi:hypothetical protein